MPNIEGQRVFIANRSDLLKRSAIAQGDYSLRRSGAKDAARHDEKIKETLRDNLDGILSDEAIITADPKSKRVIKVPLRSLVLPHIIHKDGNDGVGAGAGDKGDVIGIEPGQGRGSGAGNEAGVETYETEITLEEIQKLVFADLGLPFLQPKQNQQLESETTVYDDIRPNRSPNNLDFFRTIEQNMKRNAQEHGRVEIAGITPDDYRVKRWRQEIKDENAAAVIFKRDFSGSMGEIETYLTRVFGWWTVSFLRSKYPRVEIAFIVHDTQAYEVNEVDFFHRNDGGGTVCSTAYDKALQIMKTRFSPERYNVYTLHFSDGDNLGNEDSKKCVSLIKEMLSMGAAQIGFIQVGSTKDSELRKSLTEGIKHEKFAPIVVASKKDVKAGLQAYFDATK
ncbi:MAG: DUF444 family protein, partial [bacterium]|nr:DUF444 family protein [bacterium]